MVKALFDTNILIDYLNNVKPAKTELAWYPDKAVSIMSWMEVMVGSNASNESGTRRFLSSFELIQIDDAVSERAVVLRKAHRLKLPDAIVWASAQVHSMLLVTRNTKDFPAGDPGVRSPYRI